MIHLGDCLDVMAAMEPESVDAIVTDPPYGLEFMGKAWDKLEGIGEVSTWGTWPGQRGRATRMPSANANVRCRNCNGWKVGRATNKSKCNCDRPDFPDLMQAAAHPMQQWHQHWAEAALRVAKPSAYLLAFGGTRTVHRMTVALEDAGWIIRDMLVWAYASGFPKSKASLKPAWEPIVMARKPGPLRELAIDACRIGRPDGDRTEYGRDRRLPHANVTAALGAFAEVTPYEPASGGRWPANVILTDPIFDGGWDGVVGGGEVAGQVGMRKTEGGFRFIQGDTESVQEFASGEKDLGTYSRFFLVPKSSRSDREPVLGGLPLREPQMLGGMGQGPLPQQTPHRNVARANVHPTVKPVDLMRHLVRLVTPTGGTVLDPFLGSGTTGLAAEQEGFPWIGIEREAEYVAIAEARLNGTQKGLGLPA